MHGSGVPVVTAQIAKAPSFRLLLLYKSYSAHLGGRKAPTTAAHVNVMIQHSRSCAAPGCTIPVDFSFIK